MKTAISEVLMESTVKPISREPSMAASKGDMPASMWRLMFSMTTIASSTTKPVEMVSAISERVSRGLMQQHHHGEGAEQRERHRRRWE